MGTDTISVGSYWSWYERDTSSKEYAVVAQVKRVEDGKVWHSLLHWNFKYDRFLYKDEWVNKATPMNKQEIIKLKLKGVL